MALCLKQLLAKQTDLGSIPFFSEFVSCQDSRIEQNLAELLGANIGLNKRGLGQKYG